MFEYWSMHMLLMCDCKYHRFLIWCTLHSTYISTFTSYAFIHCSKVFQCFSFPCSIQPWPRVARLQHWSMINSRPTESSQHPNPSAGNRQSELPMWWMELIRHGQWPMTHMRNSQEYRQAPFNPTPRWYYMFIYIAPNPLFQALSTTSQDDQTPIWVRTGQRPSRLKADLFNVSIQNWLTKSWWFLVRGSRGVPYEIGREGATSKSPFGRTFSLAILSPQNIPIFGRLELT